MTKSISYSITLCNEEEEVKKLLHVITRNIRPEDEICILVDEPKCPETLGEMLMQYKANYNFINLRMETFNGDFGSWKNILFDMSTKDYLFFIDADELITKELMEGLPYILENNPIDVLGIARRNTVEGITEEYIRQMRWNINEEGYINFPDTQLRIIKNDPLIKWQNRVHEVPRGYSTISVLPERGYYLIHHKTIQKQIQQNNYYSTL